MENSGVIDILASRVVFMCWGNNGTDLREYCL